MINQNMQALMDPVANEALEEKLIASGAITSAISMVDGKIYDCDAREYVDEKKWLVDVRNYNKARVFGASGKTEEANKLKIFSEDYKSLYEDFRRIEKTLENTYTPYHQIMGAAGIKTTLAYETTRRINDLLDVSGQQYNLEDFTAKNMVNVKSVDKLKFKFHRKTSARLKVQKQIGDEVVPDIARQAFASDDKEIFADSFHYIFSLREQKESVFPLDAEIRAEIPGAFENAKDETIITILNAISGTNQGDWDATTGNFYDARAAEQVQVAEDATKKYGRPLGFLASSNVWRNYMDNLGSAFDGKAGNKSTSTPAAKTVGLPGNPGVSAWINDNITTDAYALVSIPSFMRGFQGAVVQVAYKNSKTPGQGEGRILFDFNGWVQSEASAGFFGTSVIT